MKRRIRLAAGDDIAKAVEFYHYKRRSLATRFIDELDSVLSLIERYPELGREIGDGYRHFPLNRFPYLVHYRIDSDNDSIEVVAVTHESRRPNLWRSRVDEAAAGYQAQAA